MDHTTEVVDPPAPSTPAERSAPALANELLTDSEERGQVTVHCHFVAGLSDAIRIWPSTYLRCRLTGHRSRLVHAEGIPHAPVWRPVPAGSRVSFTLLFEPLPDGCLLFDLIEEIPDEGGFFSPSIPRNGMDVYRVGI